MSFLCTIVSATAFRFIVVSLAVVVNIVFLVTVVRNNNDDCYWCNPPAMAVKQLNKQRHTFRSQTEME